MNKDKSISQRISIVDMLVMTIGAGIYSFGIVFFNMYNHLADGGVTGITLILKALFNINPAYSTILVNIPLFLIGYRFLGKRDMIYTLYGTFILAVFLWIWQKVPLTINIEHDLLLSAIGAGIFGGFGCGLVYRFGGTTGGVDIVARLFERFKGVQMGQTLLIIDVVVLLSSLVYLNIRQMAYTLIYVFIFSMLVNFTQQGAYTARGILIISKNSQGIAEALMEQLERGVTFLDAEGGFSNQPRKVIYCVVAPNELHDLKMIIESIDEQAFVSIINVNEAIGEGFTYKRPKRFKLFK
ncbi:YitT family protein [Lentilactobacillus laojiaonis]|uniref:YitT family protein n=1 Tax=Lentilactobacillus laojiaonis TaxID=2883998 RepID=UPI001D0AAE00|nr:YitT family protein [Lentilactobacillus laojiaonis]UDM31594.1 YitT family protein [Lentilactobacillus laojiaonis]